jgi:hypothetical protein
MEDTAPIDVNKKEFFLPLLYSALPPAVIIIFMTMLRTSPALAERPREYMPMFADCHKPRKLNDDL